MDHCLIISGAIIDISDTTGATACELEHVKSDRYTAFNQPKVFQNPNRI